MYISITQIAKVCHDANKSLCEASGDFSQKSWEGAEQWQKDSAEAGVRFRIQNQNAPPSAQHEAWMEDKIAGGWIYGEIKDAEAKTHPCIVPYHELPLIQRAKDHLFQSIVDSLLPFVQKGSQQ